MSEECQIHEALMDTLTVLQTEPYEIEIALSKLARLENELARFRFEVLDECARACEEAEDNTVRWITALGGDESAKTRGERKRTLSRDLQVITARKNLSDARRRELELEAGIRVTKADYEVHRETLRAYMHIAKLQAAQLNKGKGSCIGENSLDDIPPFIREVSAIQG